MTRKYDPISAPSKVAVKNADKWYVFVDNTLLWANIIIIIGHRIFPQEEGCELGESDQGHQENLNFSSYLFLLPV